jgi:hypothetical protein
MPPSSSPRKVVPLSMGDDWEPSNKPKSWPSLTKRAFFCAVVVEGPGHGKQYSEGADHSLLLLSPRDDV